jgi:hypothetical protein
VAAGGEEGDDVEVRVGRERHVGALAPERTLVPSE